MAKASQRKNAKLPSIYTTSTHWLFHNEPEWRWFHLSIKGFVIEQLGGRRKKTDMRLDIFKNDDCRLEGVTRAYALQFFVPDFYRSISLYSILPENEEFVLDDTIDWSHEKSESPIGFGELDFSNAQTFGALYPAFKYEHSESSLHGNHPAVDVQNSDIRSIDTYFSSPLIDWSSDNRLTSGEYTFNPGSDSTIFETFDIDQRYYDCSPDAAGHIMNAIETEFPGNILSDLAGATGSKPNSADATVIGKKIHQTTTGQRGRTGVKKGAIEKKEGQTKRGGNCGRIPTPYDANMTCFDDTYGIDFKVDRFREHRGPVRKEMRKRSAKRQKEIDALRGSARRSGYR
ncbi:hypothetical protein BDN70DRAFT_896351 [Pholiota conissans]|uniref:Uncharacterized protein n=1 Tax=Pholiota conissans TaxID=109636 RepID=A0A9P5YXV8_9AGAR|nr:hypothetical protein BDN70DRAFT_896351 [Pholiota conissans]